MPRAAQSEALLTLVSPLVSLSRLSCHAAINKRELVSSSSNDIGQIADVIQQMKDIVMVQLAQRS
jgi:hypothetical protein